MDLSSDVCSSDLPLPADYPQREILDTGIITNTNSQGQKGIITFYDQDNILTNAFAGSVVFSIEGQALSQANDPGFIINDHTSYSYSLEAAAGNASKINLDELSLEVVNLTEERKSTHLNTSHSCATRTPSVDS